MHLFFLSSWRGLNAEFSHGDRIKPTGLFFYSQRYTLLSQLFSIDIVYEQYTISDLFQIHVDETE